MRRLVEVQHLHSQGDVTLILPQQRQEATYANSASVDSGAHGCGHRTHCAAAKGRRGRPAVTFRAGLGSHSRAARKQRGRRGSVRRDRAEKSCSSSTCRTQVILLQA